MDKNIIPFLHSSLTAAELYLHTKKPVVNSAIASEQLFYKQKEAVV